jgi:CRP/FNR family transcriptional regulator, anaerobic regulatory protein
MQNFPFYETFSDEMKILVQENAKSVIVPKGMELFGQGDQCKDILFLTKGSVRVYRLHESGQEITLYYLEPGEQCNVNLNSAFTQTPAVGTAVSEEEIEGIMLNADIVKKLYTLESAYQQYVFELFALRLKGMAGLVEDVRFKKLDHRLLDWLHEQNSKEIKITHDKLASHLGTSREVISRLLKEFEHNGIVKLGRGNISLL